MKEKIAILWMCICLLPSCFDNHSEPGGGQYTGEETEVAFLPKANGAIPTADEVTGIEKVLQEIDIIVCDNEGKYLYYRNTWLSDGVYRTTLKAQENVTLHFIANSRSILEAKQDILVEGSSWEDNIRPALIDTRLSGIPASLPMWNVLTHVSIEDGVTKNLGTIYLLRSVAAVEVEIDETIGESIFKLEQVSLYYAPSAGLIAPLPANYDSENDIYIPEMPANVSCKQKITATNPTGNKITHALYLYENDATQIVGNKRPTRVVIGGYYKKEEKSKMVYYPLDFVDQTDNDKLVQILRNHKYEFTVTSISGEGYEDEEEAAKAPPVNMEYGIYEWIHHEDEDIGIDGPYYLSINSKKVQLDPPAGSSISLSLTTNVPDEMISCSLEGVKSTVIDQDNVFQKVESNLYRVELIKENGEIATLVFTALADWVNSNEQTLILTAGRIRFEIVITRLEPNDTSWIDGGDTNMDEDDYE